MGDPAFDSGPSDATGCWARWLEDVEVASRSVLSSVVHSALEELIHACDDLVEQGLRLLLDLIASGLLGGLDAVVAVGLDIIYLQAKRWDGTVGRPEIQKFAGALQGQRARKGIFITTSGFSAEAIDYASRIDSKIILIDGSKLTRLMFDHGVGVSPGSVHEVKRIDTDYFNVT